MNYVINDTEDESDEEHIQEHPLFKKCTSFKKHSLSDGQSSGCQTELLGSELESLLLKVDAFEKRNEKQLKEIQNLIEENFNLKAKNSEYVPIKGKLRKLESQNSVLKEKTIDIRKENDLLVEKIQTLQKRLSCEQKVRVSVSEYEETDADDACFVEKLPDIDSPSSKPTSLCRRSPGTSPPASCRSISMISRTSSINEEYLKNEEKRFQEAAEKIMRLEQRIVTLQNANKLNSCASCGPLRSHVMKIEKQVCTLVRERRSQLEELFELKQEALSSAVSEKDAHLAWLEVTMTGEGNVHTMGTIDRLRKERRELLQRMKDENENRIKLLSNLEESTNALFTGIIKMSTITSFGDYYNDDGEGFADVEYADDCYHGAEERPHTPALFFPRTTSPPASSDQEDDGAASVKSC